MLPYSIYLPDSDRNGVLFNSPHSGTILPQDFLEQVAIDPALLPYSGDTLVDQLIQDVPRHGAIRFINHFARIYVDTNRSPREIDADMFLDPPKVPAFLRTDKVARGFGVISRKSYNGLEVYDRKLPKGEINLRLAQAYHPTHQALRDLLQDLYQARGFYIMIDCHSMPSYGFIDPSLATSQQADLIIGNRFNTSCHDALSQHVADYFRQQGLEVTFNVPYAGGYNTEHYGNRDQRQQALQLEFNRALYLDEKHLSPNENFLALQETLTRLSENLNMHLPHLC
ncbi:N-formylglutamate amidohydrolase [Paremcibacter congregatus]|uniref:N-formylglutamate amidohydrolase n=1 Tax=Paremcibacter congregatus TaxID=2043170 RepID=UPI0030EB966C